MDKTEQYIKMCESAVEIQEGWKEEDGDFTISEPIPLVAGGFTRYDEISCIGCDNEYGWAKYKRYWLPRQDQLQEMVKFPVGNFNDNFWSALDDLHRYGFGDNAFSDNFRVYIPLSFEQLWLAFVMSEKYDKVWNSEEWVVKVATAD